MDIQVLLDERDISRGLSTFARILDGKRWQDLHLVFAMDIEFDYGTGEEQSGMDALRANMARYLDRCGGTQHLIGSILVDVDGDRALSQAYVQARHTGAAEHDKRIFDTNGEYIDRWERRAEGWRIVRRDARWASMSGDAAVIGMG